MLRFLRLVRARFRQKLISSQPTEILVLSCGYDEDNALPCLLTPGHKGAHF